MRGFAIGLVLLVGCGGAVDPGTSPAGSKAEVAVVPEPESDDGELGEAPADERQYRARVILVPLRSFPDDTKVLGLTEVDISTPSDPYPDWGIFGLGRMPGSVAVVSSHRLKRKPKNREHVLRRVSTVAVHEIGHTFGLPHCDEKLAECVMLDANGGIENTDASSGTFGPSCRELLERLAPL